MGDIAIIGRFRSATKIMKPTSAKAATNAFRMVIDVARAELHRIEKHDRPVVILLIVKEDERFNRFLAKIDKVSKGIVQRG
ncbi:hypothetical protein [Agrobacterium tumefaciens]|uniref:Antitoxin n=1 Tax=Agrobacterium tumefaciens TaxID=358 RepID=A0A176XJ01_AGRTU|nr:hypothetical protein [Agrobacterium tumefaciens]OAE49189.1 hypothetical protein A7J57_00825 [Agrobacterium tumefaciens]